MQQNLLKERRKAFNRKDSEAEFELDHWIFDTNAPEFKALNPNFEGREGYGQRLTWPVWGRGGRLAFYMMELAMELGAGASFQDFAEILMVCSICFKRCEAYCMLGFGFKTALLKPMPIRSDNDKKQVCVVLRI